MNWNLKIPKNSKDLLSDHYINEKGTELTGKKIALLITGSIAAYQTPELIRNLRYHGAELTIFCSQDALKFVTSTTLYWCSGNEVITEITALTQHIPQESFDLYLFIPSTYNTINKCAGGIADNIITSTFASGLGYIKKTQSKIIFFPTMHDSMFNNIVIESLKKLQALGCMVYPPKIEDNKLKLAATQNITRDIINYLS